MGADRETEPSFGEQSGRLTRIEVIKSLGDLEAPDIDGQIREVVEWADGIFRKLRARRHGA